MKEDRFPLRDDAFKYENDVPNKFLIIMIFYVILAKNSDDFDFRQNECPKIKPCKVLNHSKF